MIFPSLATLPSHSHAPGPHRSIRGAPPNKQLHLYPCVKVQIKTHVTVTTLGRKTLAVDEVEGERFFTNYPFGLYDFLEDDNEFLFKNTYHKTF